MTTTMRRYTLDNVLNNRYYQMPKFLFEGELKNLSNDARILYSLLKDRHELSIQNGWINKNNEVYLIYTREDMKEMLGVSNKTALKAVKELKKYGLIEEQQQGRGNPNFIYLTTVSNVESKTCKNYMSRSVKSSSLDMEILHPNKTDINKTDIKDNQSINQEEKKEDGLIDGLSDKNKPEMKVQSAAADKNKSADDKTNDYYTLEDINIQLEINTLDQDEKMYNELSELVFDVVNDKSKTLRVNGTSMPGEVVRSRFLKLNNNHIKYVVENFKQQTGKIKNIRSYLITSLYNSYISVSSHYNNQVQVKVSGDIINASSTSSKSAGAINAPANMRNFKQREYDEKYYESLYENA